MNNEQKIICERITAFFENLSTEFAYDYVENLHDGRGITCGRCGFCTGTGDCYLVVELYNKKVPGSALAKFLPELRRLNTAQKSDDTSRLRGFKPAWKTCTDDSIFRACQDEINKRLYWNPAQKYINRLGLILPVASACFYDTIIQHGDGDDPDSISSIIDRTEKQAAKAQTSEIDWLNAFIDLRYKVLFHASDPETRRVWKESADRTKVLKDLININPALKTPFTLDCFGSTAIFS